MLTKIVAEYHGLADNKFKQFLTEQADTIEIPKYVAMSEAEFEKHVRDFALSQAKVFMWKDKGQPEYDGKIK